MVSVWLFLCFYVEVKHNTAVDVFIENKTHICSNLNLGEILITTIILRKNQEPCTLLRPIKHK